jgi:hypothetical protein
MKTEIKIASRLIALFIINKLERMNISFVETATTIIADIEPSNAWECSIIKSSGGFGFYEPALN